MCINVFDELIEKKNQKKNLTWVIKYNQLAQAW